MKKILNTGKFTLGCLMYVGALIYLSCCAAIYYLGSLNRKKESSKIKEDKFLPIKEHTLQFKGKEMTGDGIEIVV